jgi:SOS-response transcriptional repressor LexA
MIALTKQQKRAYEFIRATIAASGGIGPTHQEVADHLGWKSKSNASRVIRALEAKGYMQSLKKRARSMEILHTAMLCPHCWHPVGSAACVAAASKPVTYSITPKQQEKVAA